MGGRVNGGGTLPLIAGFLAKKYGYWFIVETKGVYFKNRLPPTFETRGLRRVSLHHQFIKYSNIQGPIGGFDSTNL
jgi:hypothetical protein